MTQTALPRIPLGRLRTPLLSEPTVGALAQLGLGVLLLVFVAIPLYFVLAKSMQDAQGSFVGLRNFAQYVDNPNLRQSVYNSLLISGITTAITVPLALLYSMALVRSTIPLKNLFKGIALLPILAPSLLPAIALTYMFGNQGYLKSWMFGHSIYGPIGIVMAQVFYCLPHAVLILTTALGLSDARLYEVAETLGTTRLRSFLTITLPSARYGLISAIFVVFTLSITDFGIAKVIGGQFGVLAIDIYKQIIGQQNFQMGAVVGVILLLPAVLSFVVDVIVRRRQVSQLNSRAVLYRPAPHRGFDTAMLLIVSLVSLVVLSIIGTAIFASFVQMWPYSLTPSVQSYQFSSFDAAGWTSYLNSVVMAAWVAGIGTLVVFCGAYLIEKAPSLRGLGGLRGVLHFVAMLPLAVPGLVLGLGYVFFFNQPGNPLGVFYGGITVMAMCTIAHYYTVPHLAALTALTQLDAEFEAASASLGVPFWRTFWRVTVPICLPAIIDIATYLFVNAMTTVAAVIFLYAPLTKTASIAVVSMDDTGDVAAACAMALMILYTSAAVKLLQYLISRLLAARTQSWRSAERG